jgi:hypothetical protein
MAAIPPTVAASPFHIFQEELHKLEVAGKLTSEQVKKLSILFQNRVDNSPIAISFLEKNKEEITKSFGISTPSIETVRKIVADLPQFTELRRKRSECIQSISQKFPSANQDKIQCFIEHDLFSALTNEQDLQQILDTVTNELSITPRYTVHFFTAGAETKLPVTQEFSICPQSTTKSILIQLLFRVNFGTLPMSGADKQKVCLGTSLFSLRPNSPEDMIKILHQESVHLSEEVFVNSGETRHGCLSVYLEKWPSDPTSSENGCCIV